MTGPRPGQDCGTQKNILFVTLPGYFPTQKKKCHHTHTGISFYHSPGNLSGPLHWLCWVNSPGYVSLLRRGHGHEVQAWRLGPVNSHYPPFTLHMNAGSLAPGRASSEQRKAVSCAPRLRAGGQGPSSVVFPVCSSD